MGSIAVNSAKSANVSLEQFRDTVNYVNTKNKGYVRFASGPNGSVTIAKVNNQVDIPLCFRFNVSKEHNRALREKFVSALTGGLLRYADQTKVQALKNAVVGSEMGGRSKTDALSRKEVRARLSDYDKLVNTRAGRKDIVTNMLKKVLADCVGLEGFGDLGGDDAVGVARELLRKYGATEYERGLMDDLETFFSVAYGDDHKVLKEHGHEKMAKSESEFHTLLNALDNAFQHAKDCARADRSLITKATNCINVDSGDIRLEEQDLEEWRGSLLRMMGENGVKDVSIDGAVGTTGMGLDLFMAHVLPAALESIVEEVRSNKTLSQEEISRQVTERFGLKATFELLKNFLNELQSCVDEPNWLEGTIAKWKRGEMDNPNLPPEARIKDRERILGVFEGMKTQMEMINGLTIREVLFDALKCSNCKFIAKKGDRELGANDVRRAFAGASKLSERECRATAFAKVFCIRKFRPEQTVKMPNFNPKEVQAKNAELKEKVLNAVKLDVGARGQDQGVEAFCSAAMDYMANAVGAKGLDARVYNRLVSHFLPTLVNRKVDSVFLNKGKTFDLGKGGFDVFKRKVDAMLDAIAGKTAVFNKRMGAALRTFESQLNHFKRSSTLDEGAVAQLKSEFKAASERAFTAALENFLIGATADWSDEMLETGDQAFEANSAFDQRLRQAQGDVIAEMNGKLLDATRYHMLKGYDAPQYGEQVGQVLDKALHNGADKIMGNPLGFTTLTEDEAKAVLVNGGLNGVWNKVLGENPPDKQNGFVDFWQHSVLGRPYERPVVTKEWSAGVVDKFGKATETLLKKFHAFEKAFLDACVDCVAQGVRGSLEKDPATSGWDASRPEKEQKALLNALARDVLAGQTRVVGDVLREFLAHPDRFEKVMKDPDEMSMLVQRTLIRESNRKESAIGGFARVWTNRTMRVETWADSKEVRNAVFGKVHDALREKYGTELRDDELLALTSETVNARFAQAKAHAIHYSDGTVESFEKRLADEVFAAVDGNVKAFGALRANFMKGIETIEAGVRSLGEENIASVRNFCLVELAKQFADPSVAKKPKLGDAQDFYRLSLNNLTRDIVNTKYSQYLEICDKIQDAYLEMVRLSEPARLEEIEKLKKSGATERTIAAFEESWKRDFIERQQLAIAQAAYGGKDLDEFKTKFNGEIFAQEIDLALQKASLDEGNLWWLMDECGYGDYLRDDRNGESFNFFKTYVDPVLKSDEGKEAVQEFQLNAIRIGAFRATHGSKEALPEELQKGREKFLDVIRRPLEDAVKAEWTADFVHMHFSIAHAVFMHAVENRQLVDRGGAESETDREMLEKLFAQRVHDLGEKAAQNLKSVENQGEKAAQDVTSVENELVLSQTFIGQVLDIFNGRALNNKLDAWDEGVRGVFAENLTKKHPDLFSHGMGDDPVSEACNENTVNVLGLATELMAKLKTEISQLGIDQWNEAETQKTFTLKAELLLDECLRQELPKAKAHVAEAKAQEAYDKALPQSREAAVTELWNLLVSTNANALKSIPDLNNVKDIEFALKFVDDAKLTEKFRALWNPAAPYGTPERGKLLAAFDGCLKLRSNELRGKCHTYMFGPAVLQENGFKKLAEDFATGYGKKDGTEETLAFSDFCKMLNTAYAAFKKKGGSIH